MHTDHEDYHLIIDTSTDSSNKDNLLDFLKISLTILINGNDCCYSKNDI